MAQVFTLKDGSEVADKRLARIVQFDENSRSFPIRATISADAKPRSYTWSCGAHLDQGAEGACVGAAMTHELIARPSVVSGVDMAFAREQVYWEAQKADPWDGGAYPGASPFYEGTSVLAGIKRLRQLGYINEYRWCFGLEDLVLAVGYKGPAILGIAWYEGMFAPWACGHIHVSGQQMGGHAILCKGVSVKNRTFTLHNSWGAAWGDGGDCRITWDEMDRLLHENGEAVIPLSRTIPE
jgi:hypothetical protein